MGRQIIYIFILIVLSGCSIAPFTPTSTATTQGNSNWKAEAFVKPGLGTNLVRGFGDSIDLGVTFEASGSSGVTSTIWTKGALYQQKHGPSISILAGVFSSLDFSESGGYFLGPVFSYQFNYLELYAVIRRNQLYRSSSSASDYKLNHDLLNGFDIKDRLFIRYDQSNYGINYKFNDKFSMNLGGVCLHYKGETNCEPVAGIGLSF